jgi:ElaB/YqjD/DUF883 family membrane-anchored ribosome-binding protein
MTQQRSHHPLEDTQGAAREDLAKATADTTMNRVKDAAVQSEEYPEKISEQMRQYSEKAQDAVRSFRPFVRQSMKDQPMATLAAAALIGFVLGALWKK